MFPDHGHRRIAVVSSADIAAARRIAVDRAGGRLGSEDAARLDRIVAALGGHALSRSAGGTLVIGRTADGAGVDCLYFDRNGAEAGAAGVAGVDDAALDDVRAAADRFQRHDTPGVGSAMLARVLRARAADAPPSGAVAEIGALMIAAGDGADGATPPLADGWFARCHGASGSVPAVTGAEGGSGVALLVDAVTGDGAGAGGPLTAAMVRRVEAVVSATVRGLPTPMIVNAIRRDLNGGLGAGMPDAKSDAGEFGGDGRCAVAVLRVDAAAVDYTALGTVAGAVVRHAGDREGARGEIASLGARWAMVGYNPQAPAAVHLLWGPGDHVVLYSSGCARLPALFLDRGLHEVDPTLAALILLRDGAVRDDDHTILILRNRSGAA